MIFVEVGPAGGHRLSIGGLPAIERRLRELARAGATAATVAAEPMTFARPLPLAVTWVAPGTPPPPDAQIERGDVIAGVEIVDDASRRRAEWTCIRGMNKSFQGPVDALVNWRFSMPTTRFLSRAGLWLTPNLITLSNIVVGLLACLVASGAVPALRLGGSAWASFALGGVLLEVQSILDSCDGELARLRFQFSKLGQWLDNVSDDVIDNGFILACGWGLGGTWREVAIVGVALRLFYLSLVYLDVYRRTGTGDVMAFRWFFDDGAATTEAVYDPTSLMTWVRATGRRDTYVFLYLLVCVAGVPQVVVCHGFAMGVGQLGLILVHHVVLARRRSKARA